MRHGTVVEKHQWTLDGRPSKWGSETSSLKRALLHLWSLDLKGAEFKKKNKKKWNIGISFACIVTYFFIWRSIPVAGAPRDLLTPSVDGGRGRGLSPPSPSWSLPRTSPPPPRPPTGWMDVKVLWPRLKNKKPLRWFLQEFDHFEPKKSSARD